MTKQKIKDLFNPELKIAKKFRNVMDQFDLVLSKGGYYFKIVDGKNEIKIVIKEKPDIGI